MLRKDSASIELNNAGDSMLLKGSWLNNQLHDADAWYQQFSAHHKIPKIKTIDASKITAMDTAGAFLFYSLQQKLLKTNPAITISGLQEKFQSVLKVVANESAKIEKVALTPPHYNLFYRVGKSTVENYQHMLFAFAFLGEVFVRLFEMITNPVRLQLRSMIYEIEVGGYGALPIIAVMMLLIGVVVAYQLGVQLRVYGADVYIVDLSGVSILREFSPLICSVIIAGRTSTSFAALIGTMKVNEEVDALRTMGLSPIERLVLPKILGLLIALPLLVVWGDIFGVFGSMIISKSMIGIGFHAFLERFKETVAIKHFYLGLVKTPVFALIIAGIGCYQGLQASGSAQSVGERTTKAAVQAIFMIILADGLFSILFNWMDL